MDVLKVVCDVKNDAEVKGLGREVRERWGRVDVVIANAGVMSSYIPTTTTTDKSSPRPRAGQRLGVRHGHQSQRRVARVSRFPAAARREKGWPANDCCKLQYGGAFGGERTDACGV